MTVAYFDCFAGAGGDMIVGALLDAGANFDVLQAQLAKLHLHGYGLRKEPVRRSGMAASKFHVDVEHHHDHPHRHLSDILAILREADLPPRAKERAEKVFTRLAQAEAKVHGVTIEEVHFHEVGAVDSIVDVIGSCLALELLNVDRILCSPIPLGSGTINTAHGLLPVPAPATAELLTGVITFDNGVKGEATTPTAAAVFVTLAESFGPMPALTVQATGYGAGTREGGPLPNLLRVFIGQSDEPTSADTVVELSANIDDCTGEVLGATVEMLLAAGCLDAWASPIVMKKSRPAWMLCALCNPGDVKAAEAILFGQTTTFGIRRRMCQRTKLQRSFQTVETPFGPVRIKIGQLDGRTVTAAPEFSDCAAAAQSHHQAVKDVLLAALIAWKQGKQS